MARRNFNLLCFTKFKSLSSSSSPPVPPVDPPEINHSRLLISPSQLLINNFNSLYEHHTTSDSDSDSDNNTTPDFATAFASQRFFFSSPGRSNSIVDSSSLASTSTSSILSNPHENDAAVGSIAVPTYSPDPYMDFRQSMQEMVEARGLHDVRENWDYLHELLLCYLSLNPKTTHKFIIGAFADLLVTLVSSPPEKISRNKSSPVAGNCKV